MNPQNPSDKTPVNPDELILREIKTEVVGDQTWITMLTFLDEILVHQELQELAERLVWPATPAFRELATVDGKKQIYQLRVLIGEVTPENLANYNESLVRTYEPKCSIGVMKRLRKCGRAKNNSD